MSTAQILAQIRSRRANGAEIAAALQADPLEVYAALVRLDAEGRIRARIKHLENGCCLLWWEAACI